MSKYGTSTYGVATYGASVSSIATTMTASPVNYGRIQIDWATPGGSSWSRMRLVRNSYGYPITADDGVVLFDINSGPAATGTIDTNITSYTDSGLKTGRFYYYALYVQVPSGSTLPWQEAATVEGLSVADHDYKTVLLRRLPGVHTSESEEVEGYPNTDTPLGRFFGLLGFDLGRTRDLIDHILVTRDPDLLTGPLMPLLTDMLGIPFQREVGLRQNRVLARNASFLNQTKGTTQGITSFASALTGYGAKILPKVNLCLDTNMSSFEASVAPWAVLTGTSATIASATGGGVTAVDGTHYLKVTAGASGDVTVGHVKSTQPANTYGIPVVAGTTYTASAYFGDTATHISPYVDLVWYDKTGAVLSTTSGSSTSATATNALTTRVSTTAAAPTNAVWVGIVLRFPSMVNTQVAIVDAVQFEATGSASAYKPARQIVVDLIASRINELSNGGFDADVAHWTATNATVAWDSTTTYNGGAGSAAVSPTAANATIDQTVTVDGGQPFAFSAEIRNATASTYALVVKFYDGSSTLISTATSTTQAVGAGQWARVSTTGTIPTNAVTADVFVKQNGTVTAFNVDDVLFEETSAVKPYFDQRLNPGDVYYEGTTSESRAHLYPNGTVARALLVDQLPKWVPLGSPFAVVLAQPRS